MIEIPLQNFNTMQDELRDQSKPYMHQCILRQFGRELLKLKRNFVQCHYFVVHEKKLKLKSSFGLTLSVIVVVFRLDGIVLRCRCVYRRIWLTV